MRIRAGWFTVLLLLLARPAPGEDDYYPMHVGDEWTQVITMSSANGRVGEGTLHWKREGVVEKDGMTYLQARGRFEGLGTSREATVLSRKDERGIHTIDEDKHGKVEQLDVPLPLVVGMKFNQVEVRTPTIGSVLGLESVDAGGRHYENCYHVHYEPPDKSWFEDTWLAPNVGIVKSVVVYADGDKFITTLKDFKPGK